MYDAIVIGAGMSGLAAGIRLGMANKKVVIVESHNIPGGLNSYYKKGQYPLDVGLHALTNTARKGEKKRPLLLLLRQLRIKVDELDLSEQEGSSISFPQGNIKFNNDISLLIEEVNRVFPKEISGFQKLVSFVESSNPFEERPFGSAREFLRNYISDRDLEEMIMCPLLIYGSAWEEDMAMDQFLIMFRAVFLEGFSRPQGGVRTILDLLVKRFHEVGGEIRYRFKVDKIIEKDRRVQGVRSNKGEELLSKQVFSSAGLPETDKLVSLGDNISVGRPSFCESLFILPKAPSFKDTITFYSKESRYHYRRPLTTFDSTSAVLCCTNNFKDDNLDYGLLRVTFLANAPLWQKMDRGTYKEEKEKVLLAAENLLNEFLYEPMNVLLRDCFSPKTITKFTRRIDGAVYGSPEKQKSGETLIKDLFLIGTDQGFLGVVGSMLSGVSIANRYGLGA